MNLSKTLLRRTLLIVTLAGFVLSLVLIFHFIPERLIVRSLSLFTIQNSSALLIVDTKQNRNIENVVVFPKQVQANLPVGQTGSLLGPEGTSGPRTAGLPIHLKIPKINVDSAVEYVGLTPQGAMDVPKGPANVAWFNLGPRPGENGSAVIAGHYGWKNSTPAVFDNLRKLQKGDKLYVEDEKGANTTFVVRESRMYDQKTDASEVFGSSDGKAHLNLITCDGVWNKAQKSYSNRLVIFTDKEMK